MENNYITETTKALILTLRIDDNAQQYFNRLRKIHFPPARNFLDAHLTLFHKLPQVHEIEKVCSEIVIERFDVQVVGLMNLGAGVAFRIESPELIHLRQQLKEKFKGLLSAQDQQGFRPHITIQNKTNPALAKKLLEEIDADFKSFSVQALGIDLWQYLGGPWAHQSYFSFKTSSRMTF